MNYLRKILSLRITRRFHVSKQLLQNTDRKIRGNELISTKPNPSKIDLSLLPPRTVIDAQTIALLERLSLVDFGNKEGIKTLEEAIAFADQILQVDISGVEPLVSVLEDRPLLTRDDQVTDGNCRDDILSNSLVTEDEYFVAPPGNIPLEPRDSLLQEANITKR